MEASQSTLRNVSIVSGYDHSHANEQTVSDIHRDLCTVVVHVIMCGVVSVFGAIANVLNLIIFYKQGLNTTINISFFSLAICDLCVLLLTQLFNLYVNPLFQSSSVPMTFTEVQYVTSGVPREAFARITCLITVFVTAERCLCVTFPLHVKQMITPRRTALVMFFIYSLTFMSVIPFYTAVSIVSQFSLQINRTIITVEVKSHKNTAEGAVYFIHSICEVLSFLSVILLTCLLIHKLREKSVWRRSASSDKTNSESLPSRDRKTVRMVILIASILIICYTPATLLCAATFIEPEFSIGGKYHNLMYILWAFAVLFENINSSANILLYLKMSTKYRETFLELFGYRGRQHVESNERV